jgi:two-component system response regulator YesN
MPGCDGLEMIAKARELNSRVDFIIISGYGLFEYAKKAIQYEVQEFIVKPVKKEELCAVLQKMKDKYLARGKNAATHEQLAIELRNDLSKLRSGIFDALNASAADGGQETAHFDSLEALNRAYHFNFQNGMFQAFVAKIDCPAQEDYKNAMSFLAEKLIERLQASLKPFCYDLHLRRSGTRVLGLMNFSAAECEALRRNLKAALDDFRAQSDVYGRMALTIGIGEPVRGASELRETLAAAEDAVMQRLVDGAGALIEGGRRSGIEPRGGAGRNSPDTLNGPNGHAEGPSLRLFRSSMDQAVETLDPNMLKNFVEQLKSRLAPSNRVSGRVIYDVALDAHSAFYTLLRSRYSNVDSLAGLPGGFAEKADCCESLQAFFGLIEADLSAAIAHIREELEQAELKPLRLAKRYIQEHYASSITLEKLASVINFSPTYLSTLFKKETGQNFLEYLSEVRMDHARAMLKETNATIADICRAVGYSDLKHFTGMFKKSSGLKPNEYRKLFS